MTDDTDTNMHTEESPGNSEEVYVFPASYAQQRLWFLDQFEPGSPYYNIPSAMRIKGKFDIPVFKKVLGEIVRRHEALRTNFLSLEGKPVQVISKSVDVPFLVLDLKKMPEEEKELEIKRILKEKARCSFDLLKDPLLKVTVLELGPVDHVVIVVMHHIISDGWSMGLFVQEISTLYNAFSLGIPSPMPELTIQYADFSMWQKEFMQGERLEKELSYWRHRLEGSSQVLRLPTDRPRPSVWTNNGATLSRTIPQSALDGLMELCRKEKVTLFMTLMASFQILLHKYSSQHDISVGTPIANRTRRELEGIIGLFINTIVIRTEIDEAVSFRDYLKKVRTVTLEGYENQDLPFEFLVEKLQPGRDMSYQPMFQVMFILQNLPLNSQPFHGLDFRMLDVDMGTSTFDITLTVAETYEGLDATIEYNTDLFDESTISRMLRHYENLINHILLKPEESISSLSMMDESERNMLLYEWNNSEVEFEEYEVIQSLFEKQAELCPDETALTFEGSSLSYRELNERSNQLAHRLIRQGVLPEDIVGILLDRSLDMMTGVLGVLKSGAAYLPLDASYPVDRLSFMLEDAGVKTLVTQSNLRNILPEYDGSVILIDTEWDEISRESIMNPVCPSDKNNLAYVIYTSGSTGRPKGTMIQHASLINAYQSWEMAYELTTRARSHLQMASFSFDVFAGDWTRALCSGGKLVIAPREILLEGEKLYNLMRQEGVNIAEFVPAVLRNLIQYLDTSGNNLNFFHLLIAGSDVWYAGEYRKFLKYCGENTRLINSFGLTEATIDSSYFESTNLDIPNDRLVPIGRPFSNMTLYVLDRNLEPLAPGLTGELYVGGKGLARGYLKRPDVTAEKFIPDPFSKIPGQRLYKTGDMARFLPDGNVEFLGRMDNQIKLRGLRVELGEIETAVSEFDSVRDSVVIAREDTPGDKKIVAYIVTRDGNPIPAPELKHFLADRLPEYMIPSAFVTLEKLPVTPNGKVDRRALPAPDVNEIMKEMESNYVAPRSVAEGVIASIWSGVLKVPKIGINDNFFELGGHSLLATQVISRIRTAFNIEIPLRSIFENPTVARMGQIVEKEEMKKNGLISRPVLPAPREALIPLSFAQERLWFLDQLEPGNSFYNMPETYRIKGKLDKYILEESLNEVVRRHEILRTSFLTVDGKPSAVISPELKIMIGFTDLSIYPSEEQDKIIENISLREAQRYIPLTEAPLFRTTLLKVSEEDYIIKVILHHIITDEWSSGIMLREIALMYNALLLNTKPSLPELNIQYTDYAFWQREYLRGENLERQLSYWKDKLSGIPLSLELPFDHPRPPIQTYRGDYISLDLSPELVKALRDFNRQSGVTLFMTMLSCFQVLLYRLSGQMDIVIGTPVANRSKEELEALIGFFVNTLVLRCRISRNMKFLDLLKETTESSLEAFTYQELPFEMLVDALQPERTLSHSPLFQVMFVIQNAPVEEYGFTSDLKLFPHEVHSMTSKFDLTLFVSEKSEEAISMAFEYNTDLFEKETIEMFFRHYKSIIECVLINNDLAISDIPLLSREEEIAVTEKLAEGHSANVSLSQLVHEAFETTASLKMNSPALIFMGRAMTYGELNSRSNKLAHYLMKKGAGPETAVGIALKKSPELIISLLAVLKSGGCYIPLDMNYPLERLDYIVQDSKLKLLITEKELASKFSGDVVETILIDTLWDEIEKESALNPALNRPLEDNLAYIIYTSGSTGRPKGTMITHRNLMNYLSWCISTYPLNEETGSVFHLSISFDAAVTSIYPALLSGSPVKIIPDGTDIYRLGQELFESGTVGTLKLTPAHMDVLQEQLKNAEANNDGNASLRLKAFVVGGENLTRKQISYYQDKYPETLIYNEYGPTEAAVGCIVYEASGLKTEGSVPIGRVIPGVYVCLLDENMNIAPVNTPAELYIGGLGLSRGYLERPDLTAEKFIPDPFSSAPGMRLYKTGDKVKLLRNGSIEFLGRLDEQLKLHGYRIEPGEIEAALMQHSAVKEALVLKHTTEEKLVAYCIPRNEHIPETKEIREYLEKKVPSYMVPSVFMFIEQFPLTVNGKIDRKKLPEPRLERAEITEGYIAPVTEAELLMAGIWQSVLNVDKVGITDNFFELGGDSIISIQLVSRANQAGFRLTPRDIFQNPTVKSLALAANGGRVIKAPQGIVSGQIPLSPVQHWFFEQSLYNIHHYNQSLLFEVEHTLDITLLETVLKEILIHHDALRICFNKNEETWEQFNRGIDKIAPLIRVDLSAQPEEELPRQIEKLSSEFQASLDISSEPLKMAYFDTGKNRKNYLFIAVHHLLIDAVSWRILLDDFQTAYTEASQLKKIRLPLKTSSFMDWSKRLNEYAQTPEVAAEFDFWQKLKNSEASAIPADYKSNDGNLEQTAGTLRNSLEAEDTGTLLKELPKVLNAEIMHPLLTALVRAFNSKTGKTGLLIELESHGRVDLFPDLDVSRTIGWFTSIYPVYLELGNSESLKESVEKVKEQMNAIPNNGIGFGMLKYLSKDKSLISEMQRLPKPEIAFNYLGQFDDRTSAESSILPAQPTKGEERSPHNKRSYLIEITAAVVNGRLNLEWTYNSKIYKENTMLLLANAYLEEIRAIVNLVRSQKIDLRAKDYSDLGWNTQEVDDILSVINRMKE
ncbi:MAG: amino acid adenylation domain-containing protein [Ignavibacteria bacterium]|jgi:amino acid adenylation domain-containing protein/non-ribosomal peptide synthase protein (TIGR01720 family)|nr:amino acid adenylation domain-containing protein [Ignavibacteria bacterium]